MKMSITADDVERAFRRQKERERRALAGEIEDLELHLQGLPYYKPCPDGIETSRTRPSCGTDTALHNATIFVDSPYNVPHQGDITIDTLREIKDRIGGHKVFIFAENNRNRPMSGPFDLTALRPMVGASRPWGKEKTKLENADIILEDARCEIKEEFTNRAYCKEAGFKTKVKPYWLE